MTRGPKPPTARPRLNSTFCAVGGFGPLVISALAAAYSWRMAIALLSAIYVVDMLATALLIPERKGAALE